MDIDGFKEILSNINDEEEYDNINTYPGLLFNNEKNKQSEQKSIEKLQQEIFKTDEEKNIQLTEKQKKETTKSIHLGHRQRAKERFLSNPDAISDYDLIELLLFLIIPRSDVRSLAKKLIDEYKTIGNFLNSNIQTLNKSGVNGKMIKYLTTLFQIVERRILVEKMNNELIINNIQTLVEYCQNMLGTKKEEQFRIIFFNSKFKVLDDVSFGTSGVTSVLLSCKDIIRKCLDTETTSVILYHNHPSRNVYPSKSDIETTEQIKCALSTIEVNVIDHIIVGGDKYLSFKQESFF